MSNCCNGYNNYEIYKTLFFITNYQSLVKLAGMVEMVDTFDLDSRFWGFESLFPYKIWVMSNQQ